MDYVSTWHILYNQMEAAGYPPTTRQALTMFIDRLPTDIVSFITLYNNIMISLNEPNNSLLPNIHHLFDHVIRIDGNVNHSWSMSHDNCTHQSMTVPTSALTNTATIATPAAGKDTESVHKCGNCSRLGHSDDTCFQPDGKMEGHREEYLASRLIKNQAYLTNVEDIQEVKDTDTANDSVLTEEFAAMSINVTNEIDYSSYSSLSSVISPLDEDTGPVIFATLTE